MDAEAKEEYAWLFRAEFASVARTVFLIVHDRGRAEDIAQEAFLKMLQNWRVVSGYERPDAWERRVAIRMAGGMHAGSGFARASSARPPARTSSGCRIQTSRGR